MEKRTAKSETRRSFAPMLFEYQLVLDADLSAQRHSVLGDPARCLHDHLADCEQRERDRGISVDRGALRLRIGYGRARDVIHLERSAVDHIALLMRAGEIGRAN